MSIKLIRIIERISNGIRLGIKYSNLLQIGLVYIKKRNKPGSILFLRKKLFYRDNMSFLKTSVEIFLERQYLFNVVDSRPIIIDCGSNIGLSLIFFKMNYPNSIIYGFEPDIDNFNTLLSNISGYNFKDINISSDAVWIEEGVLLNFNGENNESSRLSFQDKSTSSIKVKTTRLRDLIVKLENISLLKIDIEGAEVEVLNDCKDVLNNCENIFVEYHSFYGQKQELDKILQILTNLNFRYQIKEAFTRSKPFLDNDSFNGEMDFQANIFATKSL
jgi:FkbM family methyltransferase